VGDPKLIPIPAPAKLPTDVAVLGTAFLGWFQAIPWSGIAAALAGLYTLLLIIEKGWGWCRRWKQK
jgi:hypothetical protein